MNDMDFTGKRVLVVGGTSGIGNGIAQAFRERGARVAVWGTRDASDYRVEDGSDLSGLTFARVDASDSPAVAAAASPFDGLDVLILAQGTVLYRKGEFEMDGFRKVVSVNLDSMMACAMRFLPDLKASGGNIITISSTSAYHATRGNPAYNASKAGVVAQGKGIMVHEIPVETFEMRSAINEDDLPGDVLRFCQIDHGICNSGWRWKRAQWHHACQSDLLFFGIVIG
eukprot:gene33629-45041_t